MKINVICVGKLKERYWREACAEYEKRLSRFCRLTVRELPEKANPAAEAEEILKTLSGYVIALAVEGKRSSSEAFAAEIKRLFDAGLEITFVIGSSCGLAPAVKARANALCSFSEMTFPHQMFRVILLEQLYRAFMINTGSEYHK
ncbi:MAG: 23S rRNA (pseudouridine(1915)-N(3))-methyltransferase RlmH [Clostridia bacterium]|nr:23S rRNA (pseudouridine(1915)-N(3))-methyltransferase RlmH [Clostridia bacterium]